MSHKRIHFAQLPLAAASCCCCCCSSRALSARFDSRAACASSVAPSRRTPASRSRASSAGASRLPPVALEDCEPGCHGKACKPSRSRKCNASGSSSRTLPCDTSKCLRKVNTTCMNTKCAHLPKAKNGLGARTHLRRMTMANSTAASASPKSRVPANVCASQMQIP